MGPQKSAIADPVMVGGFSVANLVTGKHTLFCQGSGVFRECPLVS
jgi:hypothetical protein